MHELGPRPAYVGLENKKQNVKSLGQPVLNDEHVG
jgi:hypothetical protein